MDLKFCISLTFFIPFSLFAQQLNIGIPIIENFPKEIYDGGTQTWDINTDNHGRILFANNQGLLSFDGKYWNINPLPNKTIVRSIEVVDDKIYVGGQNELGYFKANQNGILEYHSLKQLLAKAHQDFTDVWDIEFHDGSLFFRTNFKLFQYKNQTFKIHPSNSNFRYLGKSKNTLFVQDDQLGLLSFNGEKITEAPYSAYFKDKIVTAATQLDDAILVCTLKNGLFKITGNKVSIWDSPDFNLLKKERIYHAKQLQNGNLAIATSLNGVYLINKEGRITENISNKQGLQNNNVLFLYEDAYQNLWAGLDNGIDYIKLSSPYRLIYPDGNLQGTGYATVIHKEKLYLGTSNGLFVLDWKPQYFLGEQDDFRLIPGTQGQVWNLNIVDNQLILGHHEGSFIVDDERVNKISNIEGAWLHKKLDESLTIKGHYNGLSIDSEQNQFNFKAIEGDFQESSRFLEVDGNQVWVSHPYKGVYKIQLDTSLQNISEIRLYDTLQGLPSELFNHVFKIENEILVTGEKGIYSYDNQKDSFVINTTFSKQLGSNNQIKRLIPDKKGNIWFVKNDDVGVINVDRKGLDRTLEIETFPFFHKKLVGGFENIYPYDERNIILGSEKGFIHFTHNQQQSVEDSFHLLISEVNLIHPKERLIYKEHAQNLSETFTFETNEDAIRFNFAATHYPNLKNIKYQYKLDGIGEEWSSWTDKTEKEYNNLKHGKYTFHLRAKNQNGLIVERTGFEFEIQAPWYLSYIAYTIYIILSFVFLASIIFIPQKRFSEEKAQLKKVQAQKEQAFQAEIEETEKALIQVKNEKLQAELALKNRTLTSSAMHLVQKSGLINKLRKDLEEISKDSEIASTKKRIKKIIRQLSHDEHLDDEWENFVLHFEQVHSGFTQRINREYPNLTPKEQKLCIYLRMNFSTKEIAQMMNISVRGVEISRYRLRKKLNLDTEINLSKFMMNY